MFRYIIFIRFIHCLFNNAARCLDYIMVHDRMISEKWLHMDAKGNGRGLNDIIIVGSHKNHVRMDTLPAEFRVQHLPIISHRN
jgi:hypothetical protein